MFRIKSSFALAIIVIGLFSNISVSEAAAVTLTLSPSNRTGAVNQNFNVDILLDTGGNQVDGVDLYSLHFNPAILQVVDSNSGASGIQISPGTILPNNVIDSVDNTTGTILYSQATTGGTYYNGSGVLATITFRGASSGTSAVTFDFTPGSTADTNVAFQGSDLLSSVGNGSYAIDGTAPTISITAPTNFATVSGTTSVTATASDNIGVAGVQFKLDGVNLGAEDVSSPYSLSWDTTTATNTSHSLSAVGRDAAGNTTTSTITVTVNNIPFDFTISNGGAKSVMQGSNVTNVVNTTLITGSAASVTFSASGLPSGVSASFSPATCAPTCSSTLTLTANGSATVGTTTTTVTATSSTTHSTTFSLTVNSSTFQRTINFSSLEARTSRAFSGTLSVLNSSKALIKSFAFSTNSVGDASITFDITPQAGYLKFTIAPFLTRLISVDLNSAVTYSFPQMLTGDINQDNIVNSVDYSVLNTNWFTSSASGDLNQDGLVNTIDYSFMNKHWLVTGDQ